MQPPPLTPRSITGVAVGAWTLAMASLTVAVALDTPWLLLGVLAAPLFALGRVHRGPPPRAVLRALASNEVELGYDDGLVRTARVSGRTLRIWTDRTPPPSLCVAVPHGLPLADATWVARTASGIQSRHAPWDLRTRVVEALPWPSHTPAIAVILTDDSVRCVVPTEHAAAVSGALSEWVDWSLACERTFVEAFGAHLAHAGIRSVHLQTGPAGLLCFAGEVGDPSVSTSVQIELGRFKGDVPHWRGRPEARLSAGCSGGVQRLIGPCTRDLDADLTAFVEDVLARSAQA